MLDCDASTTAKRLASGALEKPFQLFFIVLLHLGWVPSGKHQLRYFQQVKVKSNQVRHAFSVSKPRNITEIATNIHALYTGLYIILFTWLHLKTKGFLFHFSCRARTKDGLCPSAEQHQGC